MERRRILPWRTRYLNLDKVKYLYSKNLPDCYSIPKLRETYINVFYLLGGRDPYEPPFNAPFVNQGANDMNDIDSIVEEKLEDKMENIFNR